MAKLTSEEAADQQKVLLMVQKSHSQPPRMVLKPVVNNGINYCSLNWWLLAGFLVAINDVSAKRYHNGWILNLIRKSKGIKDTRQCFVWKPIFRVLFFSKFLRKVARFQGWVPEGDDFDARVQFRNIYRKWKTTDPLRAMKKYLGWVMLLKVELVIVD